MKKITIIILSFLLIFYSNTFVFASNTNEIHTLEVFEDGSYIEEQIDCSPTVSLFSTTSTKYGHKTATYKSSSGNTIWTITVSGIFTYNGKSSKCTKSTVTTTCVNSNWKITNKSSKKVDSTATASATATKYTNKVAVQTIKRSVSLSCSKSGKLSSIYTNKTHSVFTIRKSVFYILNLNIFVFLFLQYFLIKRSP